MLGDSLSDAHAEVHDAYTQHYYAEFMALPPEIRSAVRSVVAQLDAVRVLVDHYQVTRALG